MDSEGRAVLLSVLLSVLIITGRKGIQDQSRVLVALPTECIKYLEPRSTICCVYHLLEWFLPPFIEILGCTRVGSERLKGDVC